MSQQHATAAARGECFYRERGFLLTRLIADDNLGYNQLAWWRAGKVY
jgi:hypothetical protein